MKSWISLFRNNFGIIGFTNSTSQWANVTMLESPIFTAVKETVYIRIGYFLKKDLIWISARRGIIAVKSNIYIQSLGRRLYP